jgi:phosphate transport system protein
METRTVFHEELASITEDVAHLGALAREAIQAGTETFLDADLMAIEAVISADGAIDSLSHSIEARTCQILAQQQPMAVDLRLLVAVLRIIHELERIGDNMVNVTKATRRLYPYQLDPRVRGLIQRMREQATAQLQVAIESFVERDEKKAAALDDMDDAMDQLQKELFRVIFEIHSTEDVALQRAVTLALVGRYFERVGDLSVNVGERVRYMVTGEFRYRDGERPVPA